MKPRFNLQDIDFVKMDAEEIQDRVLRKVEERMGVRLFPADPRKLFIQSLMPIIIGIKNDINYTGKQNLLAYASVDALDHLGAMTDTARLPAVGASVSLKLTFTTDGPHVIPLGTRFTPDNELIFSTVERYEFVGNHITILVKCTTSGVLGNGYAPGQIDTLVDPLPYFDAVENITTTEGGKDIESDDAYAARIHLAPEKFSTAGPDGAYIYHAKSANQDIQDVYPYMETPGTVEVICLMQGGRLPNEEELAEVDTYLKQRHVRPLTDKVVVRTPNFVDYSIDVTYWVAEASVYQEQLVRKKIEAAVEEYIAWQHAKLGRDINTTELIYLMRKNGAARIQTKDMNHVTLKDYEVARLTTKQVTYGGVDYGT